jgi:SAM-dependent methyltransferase
MTREWLDLLKPGGRLLFNAPNRDACALKDQLWFDSAPPPDVVTLFPPAFWCNRFSDAAQIDEEVEVYSPEENFFIFLQRLARRKWRMPVPIPLEESGRFAAPPTRIGHELRRNFALAAGKVASWTGLNRLAPRYPTEYGLFVQMIKKQRCTSAGVSFPDRKAFIA